MKLIEEIREVYNRADNKEDRALKCLKHVIKRGMLESARAKQTYVYLGRNLYNRFDFEGVSVNEQKLVEWLQEEGFEIDTTDKAGFIIRW